jgi:hypothetical protein
MAVHTKLKQLLMQAELSDAESQIFVELLKEPVQSKWDLVLKTGLKKSTVYRACENLERLKMIGEKNGFIQALSLKPLVAELDQKERSIRKTAAKIAKLSPYLKIPYESVEEFETYYTPEQIKNSYMLLLDTNFTESLDFGDFENLVPFLGGLALPEEFRKIRAKRAKAHAVCTTFGENLATFSDSDSVKKYNNNIEMLDIDYTGKFISFSDKSDMVLYYDFKDPENPFSVMVKSKVVADAQRAQFNAFSRMVKK